MKPVAFIQSLTSAVGMPWEIYRHEFADHAVDLYSKGGGLGQYGSLLVLVPDYNFVFAVLAAGPDTSLSTVAADTVRTHLIRSLQQVSRNQAESQYVGHYSSFQGNNSLSIIMDDQPGLLIDEWISNGVDFLQVMSAYSEGSGSGALQAVRMYPTDLGVNYAAFRLVFISAKSVEHQPGALFAQGMRAWSAVDQIVYGQEAMDEMIFSLGNGTRVTGVESSGLRTRLAKVA